MPLTVTEYKGVLARMNRTKAILTVSISPAARSRVDAAAGVLGVTRSWLVERVLSGWLEEHEHEFTTAPHSAPTETENARATA